MAGRPKSFDLNEALNAFLQVFWTKGYNHTSVDDLQLAAGIKRGSFYASFGSKDDVFASVLNTYWDRATESILRNLECSKDPREAVARFLRYAGDFMTENTPRGCLLLSSAADLSCTASRDGELVREKMNALEARIAAAIPEETHPANPKLAGRDQASALTSFVMTILLGLNAMARSGQSADRIRQAAEYAAESVLNSGVSQQSTV